MPQKPRRIDFSPDNFIAGIAGVMDLEEIGLYWLLCSLIYSHGGPIKYDPVRWARITRGTSPRTIRTAFERLSALGKACCTAEMVMCVGCELPLSEAMKRLRRNIDNGSKGGRPPKEINDIVKPDGLFDGNPAEKHARDAPSPSPSPPKNPPLLGGPPKTKPSPVPPDWRPSAAAVEFARTAARWVDQRIETEIANCRDHHRSRGAKFLDLDAMWRTWVRNGAKFDARSNTGTAQAAKPRPAPAFPGMHFADT